MSLTFTLRYRTAAELARHLQQGGSQQHGGGHTMLLPWSGEPLEFDQYERLDLCVLLPERRANIPGELLQTIPNIGMVIRLLDPSAIRDLVAHAEPSSEDALPEVSLGEPDSDTEFDVDEKTDPMEDMVFDGDKQDPPPRAAGTLVGITALSWPIERLQADWHSVPMPEKIRVARYGKRPARAFILRGVDKALHTFLLQNSKISADEVARMAGLAHLAPDVLMRIVNSPDWTRHTNITRNLVCHPKLPLTEVRKLLGRLPTEELRRLAKSGRVRSAIKRIIVGKLEAGR